MSFLDISAGQALGSRLLSSIHGVAAIFQILLHRGRGIELEIRLHDQSHGTNLVIGAPSVARVRFVSGRQQSGLLAALICCINRAEMSIDSSALSKLLQRSRLGCHLNLLRARARLTCADAHWHQGLRLP